MDLSGKINLLLVDDEEGYLEVLKKRLSRRGMNVSTASSGEEAIRMVRDESYHAAVVDLKMGDMDGLEVLAVVRKMDPSIAVIMLTGHGSEQAAREGLALGASDYLIKPCELDVLMECIGSAIGRQKDS